MHYDATTKAFDFAWSHADRAGGGFFLPGTVTSVSIPTLIYPNGYTVQVQGSARHFTAVRADADAGHPIRRAGGDRSTSRRAAFARPRH